MGIRAKTQDFNKKCEIGFDDWQNIDVNDDVKMMDDIVFICKP